MDPGRALALAESRGLAVAYTAEEDRRGQIAGGIGGDGQRRADQSDQPSGQPGAENRGALLADLQSAVGSGQISTATSKITATTINTREL